jgi:predicted ATPase/DNA-binding SARP family transcriptional activator
MTALLRLELLGPVWITLDGAPTTGALGQKALALLWYLITERGEHARQSLATLLWSESSDADAAASLRQALTGLRRVLPDHLLITRHTVAFNHTAPYWLDREWFEAQLGSPASTPSIEHLQNAISLYRGEFLHGFVIRDAPAWEEWVALHRERLRLRALNALHTLAHRAASSGDYAAAIDHTTRVLDLDPWREEAHRHLMWLYVRNGQRSAALAQYQTCRRVLDQELGVEPMDETTALFERIKAAQATPLRGVPVPATNFVGRVAELALLEQRLADPCCRLLTIVGPGGIGKTRLALEIAMRQNARLLHGARIVFLASVGSCAPLVSALAAALGCPLRGADDPQAQVIAFLADKDLLLVLDNFEHLIDTGAELLSDLLHHAPEVKLLVTSRERLRLRDEWLLELGGLDLPPVNATDRIAEGSAVELFVRSAQRVSATFALDETNHAAIVRICRVVEGTPLAIELAAAWTRVLSCDQVAVEIERSLEFLATTLRDVPPRHRSLRAVFDHSWQLLNDDERRVTRQLSVFGGDFDREAAEQLVGTSLPMLTALVDKSLVRSAPPDRYDMHDLIRHYATQKLHEAGEDQAIQVRCARYFLDLVERADPHLLGSDQHQWFDRLEREYTNLRPLLRWASRPDACAEDVMIGAGLCSVLWRLWWVRGYGAEGSDWIAQVLEALDRHIVGADDVQTGSRSGMAAKGVRGNLLHRRGVLLHEQGKHDLARACYEESLALRRAENDMKGIAASLNSLGVLALDCGEYAQASMLYEESLALKRALGDKNGIAGSLNNLAMVMSATGNVERARALYAESLGLARELGNRLAIAVVLGNLGAVALDLRDVVEARALFAEGLAVFEALGDKDGIAECLEGLAGAYALQAAHEAAAARVAARLFGAAAALREAIGTPLIPLEQRRYDELVVVARSHLSPDVWAAAWDEGQALTHEQAIAEALDQQSGATV